VTLIVGRTPTVPIASGVICLVRATDEAACQYPRSTRMRSAAFSKQLPQFAHPMLEIAVVALWEQITMHYTSVLIVGLSPNLRNSRTMISLT
jgi:hypothetical protein